MKKTLTALLIASLLPLTALAISVPWEKPRENVQHPIQTDDVIVIGATATSTDGIFEVNGNSAFEGNVDLTGNNIDDLANITFQNGATGGHIRTGTSNADFFEIEAYDTNASAYREMFTITAGNQPTIIFNTDRTLSDFTIRSDTAGNDFVFDGDTGVLTLDQLTPSRLVTTDGSSNLVNTITEANFESSVSDVSDFVNRNEWADILAGTTTDALSEGASNLYYTDLRVGDVITGSTTVTKLGQTIESSEITDGTIAEADLDIANSPTDEYSLTYEADTSNFQWKNVSGGGGTPAGSNGEIQFNDSGSFGATSTFVWDNTNFRLGIGTASPGETLHVNTGDDTAKLFAVGNNFNPSSGLEKPLGSFTSDVNEASGIGMRNESGGNLADFRFAVFDDTDNDYLAFHMPGSGNTRTLFGETRSNITGIFGNNLGSRSLYMGTVSSNDLFFGTNNTRRMTITSGGNVGIGNSSPSTALEVVGTTTSTGLRLSSLLNCDTIDTDAQGDLLCGTDDGGSGSPAGSNGEIQFNDSGSFGATSTFVWDNTNNRLGVGTSSPVEKLTVDGDALITGEIRGRDSLGNTYTIFEQTDSNFTDGVAIRPDTNPDSGDVMFSVQSTGASDRFFVEHDGEFGTEDNDFIVDRVNNDFFVDNANAEVGIGTASPGAKLEVEGTAAAATQSIIQGAASQSANLTEWQDSTGSILAAVNSSGNLVINNDGGEIFLNNIGDQIRLQEFNGGFRFAKGAGGGFETFGTWGSGGLITQTPIDVRGTSTFNELGNDHDFRVEGTTDANLLFVDAGTNRVGIGTSSPSALLQVGSDNRNSESILRFGSNGNNTSGVEFGRFGGNTDNSIIQDDTESMKLWYQQSDLSGRDLIIQKGSASTTVAAFDQDGNMGIGTSTPAEKLEVLGEISSFSNNNNVDTFMVAGTSQGFLGTRSNHDLVIRTNNTQAIQADNSQQVQIGAGNPAHALDVSGDGRFDGDTASDVQLTIQGAASQSANLTEWQDSTASVLSVVDENGNFGIGKNNPSSPLDVSGNADISGTLNVGSLTGTIQAATFDGSSAGAIIKGGSNGVRLNTNSTTRLVVEDGGDVGIGTTTPARQLHIDDVMRLEPRSTAPTSPSMGDIYVDSDSAELCFYDGSSWTGLKAAGACN